MQNTQQNLGKMDATRANAQRDKRPSRKRRSIIIGQLCELSRNGWENAKPYDYEPLEQELKR